MCALPCGYTVPLLLSHQADYSERFPLYSYPPSEHMSSYFGSGPEASCDGGLANTHLNRVRLVFLVST